MIVVRFWWFLRFNDKYLPAHLLLHSYLTEYCRPSPNCSIYECIAYSGCVTSVNCRMQNFINISNVMAVRTDELGKASSVFLGGFECGLCFYKDKPN